MILSATSCPAVSSSAFQSPRLPSPYSPRSSSSAQSTEPGRIAKTRLDCPASPRASSRPPREVPLEQPRAAARQGGARRPDASPAPGQSYRSRREISDRQAASSADPFAASIHTTSPNDRSPVSTRSAMDPFREVLLHPAPYALRRPSKPLGSGRWSDVHLAEPQAAPGCSLGADALTPPITPTKSTASPPGPFSARVYAVKMPAMRSARAVLLQEARTLTRLVSLPRHERYIAPFLGLDPSRHALVLEALPGSLEDVINQDLAAVDEQLRTATLAGLFPAVAKKLVLGLIWLHEVAGVVHADIKPGNILLRVGFSPPADFAEDEDASGPAAVFPSLLASLAAISPSPQPCHLSQQAQAYLPTPLPTAPPSPTLPPTKPAAARIRITPLYADFSAALPSSGPGSAAAPPLGGGTWDFLSPELVRSSTSVPTCSSDVYALGMTLLCLVIGYSPFDAPCHSPSAGDFVSRIRKRESILQGRVWESVRGEPVYRQRFDGVCSETLQRTGGWDVEAFLRKGVAREAEGRAGSAREWWEWAG